MISRLTNGALARSARELAELLKGTPFRAALGISLLLHAVLLLGVWWDGANLGQRLPSMRVHILVTVPVENRLVP